MFAYSIFSQSILRRTKLLKIWRRGLNFYCLEKLYANNPHIRCEAFDSNKKRSHINMLGIIQANKQ